MTVHIVASPSANSAPVAPFFGLDVWRATASGADSALHAGGTGAAVLTLTQAWPPGTTSELKCAGWSLSAETIFCLLLQAIVAATWRLPRARLALAEALAWVLTLAPPALLVWGQGAR